MSTAFNRTNLQAIRLDLGLALAEVGAKHGITFTVGNIRFSPTEFRAKLTASSLNSTEAVEAKLEESNFDLLTLASIHHLPGNLLGARVTVRDRTYTITGAKRSNHKYPFQVTGKMGGKYKMSVEDVRQGLDMALESA